MRGSMKILGLDSSGLVAGVAVVEDDCLLAEFSVNYKKTHSQTLVPMMDQVRNMIELDLNSLDAIAVASGPGSFTGLRIGSATAKGLGLALGKPLVEVPTLEGLAYNLCGADRLVCPLMDARRGQVYSGIYAFVPEGTGWRLETVVGQQAADISVILEKLNELCSGESSAEDSATSFVRGSAFASALERGVIFLGDGVPVYADRIARELRIPYSFAPAGRNRQSAASVAALGAVYFAQGKTVSAAAHKPQYLRLSQAERERAARESEQSGEVSQAARTVMELAQGERAADEPEQSGQAAVRAAREPALHLRRFRPEDAEAVSALEAASLPEAWSLAALQDLTQNAGYIALTAEFDQKIIGFCSLTLLSGEGEIANVAIEKEFRGRGFASAMLEELLRLGTEAGVKDFTLEVREGNAAAIHLYEKLGFRSEGVRPRFYKNPEENALILWKRSPSISTSN